MDREQRWNDLEDCKKLLIDLGQLYQNRIDTIPKDLYDLEIKKANAVRDKINKTIDNYISDMGNMLKIVEVPKTFEQKLKYSRQVFVEMANANGCDGDPFTADYFLNCIDLIDDYLNGEGNEEQLVKELSSNEDIIKLNGMPRTVIDLRCSLKITSEEFNNRNTIRDTYKYLRSLIYIYGVNKVYLDVIPGVLTSVIGIVRKLKSEFRVEFKLVVLNEMYNKRWSSKDFEAFSMLLKDINGIEFTDSLSKTGIPNDIEFKDNFLIHSSRVICFIGDDYTFVNKALSSGRKTFIYKDGGIRRVR